MSQRELAVLADTLHLEQARTLWSDSDLDPIEWPEEPAEGIEQLRHLLDTGARRLVLFGGDDLVGRVVTTYQRRDDLGAYPLQLWPLKMRGSYVAGHLDAPVAPKKAVKLMEKGIDDWRRSRVRTLKVTASTQQAAWYGFWFGAGWVYEVAEARRRARGGATHLVSALGRLASETLADTQQSAVAARVSVDYEPVERPGESLVASTLKKTPFGVGAGQENALLWQGLSKRDLVSGAVTPGRLGGGGEGSEFEAVHLDSPGGWLLDGRLQGGEESSVLQIAPGPLVTLASPAGGIGAAVGRILGRASLI